MVREIKPPTEKNYTSYDEGQGSVDDFGRSQYIAGPDCLNNPSFNTNPVFQANPYSYSPSPVIYTEGRPLVDSGLFFLVLFAELITAYKYGKWAVDDQMLGVLFKIPLLFGVIGAVLAGSEAHKKKQGDTFIAVFVTFLGIAGFGFSCGIIILIIIWLHIL